MILDGAHIARSRSVTFPSARIGKKRRLPHTSQSGKKRDPPHINHTHGALFSHGVLFAFLLGLTTTHPPWKSASSIDRSALGVFVGIMYGVVAALIVGVFKFFKRTPGRLFSGDAQSADRTVFRFSIGLTVFWVALALWLEHYNGLVDAGVCGLLGVGVKYGSAVSRWLLAVYAFFSPVLVLFSVGSPGGVLWAFFFFAVCLSILAHQKESHRDVISVADAGNTSHAEASDIRSAPKPAITKNPSLDQQFSNDSLGKHAQATPLNVSKGISPTQATANPITLVSIWVEASQNMIEAHDERLYEQIAQELDTNTVDKGFWTKAYAQAGGDDQQTRVLYIKARFAKLLVMETARGDVIRQEQERAARLAKTKEQIKGQIDA